MDWTHPPTWKACTHIVGAFLCAFLMASCGKNESQTPPMLGMNFDQVEALCGPGKALGVQGQGKLISYEHISGSSVRVAYHENTAVTVWYEVGADSLEDKRLQYYLQLNAQGHQWTMLDATTQGTWLSAHWIRDDGASARCGVKDGPFLAILDPISSETGILDAPPASAQSTQNGAKFGLRRNVVVYVSKLGQPFKRDFDFMKPASTTLLFNYKISDCELMLTISFWHGVAHYVIVSRRDQKDLAEIDIQNILQMFSENEHWISEAPSQPDIQRQWSRDRNVMASVLSFGKNSLISISTSEFNDARGQVSEHK